MPIMNVTPLEAEILKATHNVQLAKKAFYALDIDTVTLDTLGRALHEYRIARMRLNTLTAQLPGSA